MRSGEFVDVVDPVGDGDTNGVSDWDFDGDCECDCVADHEADGDWAWVGVLDGEGDHDRDGDRDREDDALRVVDPDGEGDLHGDGDLDRDRDLDRDSDWDCDCVRDRDRDRDLLKSDSPAYDEVEGTAPGKSLSAWVRCPDATPRDCEQDDVRFLRLITQSSSRANKWFILQSGAKKKKENSLTDKNKTPTQAHTESKER